MMRLFRLLALAGLLLSVCPMAANAGSIAGITFSGAGGTGADGGTFGSTSEPRLFHTSLDFIDISIVVTSAGSYLLNEAPGLGFILNQTGQHWGGYKLEMLTLNRASFDLDWSYYTSPFGSITNLPSQVYASGGAGIDDGASLAMFGHFSTNGPGLVIIRQTPFAIPEPATISLGLLACCGLLLARVAKLRRS